ncbi:uncharacterized protein LOC107425706 [Ziziphus jujuba]|uniref:Uncharacterized protein LOC107425706 n=1 Tax=Ziziphus jujuba TaxID=326968 RepID=A0ABM4AEG4_ZIZJJ|nr:uncharacterized protein LOC107425706 [Ziziphus jujuba]XP_060675121.1 uncharacterized protein LOC107425706 [Ziziphus jujuba]
MTTKPAKIQYVHMVYDEEDNQHFCRSLSFNRIRSRRWRQSSMGTALTAVAALIISTSAWLSLVFSGTTTLCWSHLKHWDGSLSLHSSPSYQNHQQHQQILAVSPPLQNIIPKSPHHHSASTTNKEMEMEKLSLRHIIFGIGGSSQLWRRRKEYVRLWWRPNEMRGHIWLDEPVPSEDGDGSLPPVMVSEDISRFRYTNPVGHPSGLRISRIITECFRLRLPDVRWFVLADDDTIFNVDNLVAVLGKYDPSEMVYIGNPSESHSANTYFSHSMAFGGGGIAISHPLAEALSTIQDNCLDRYPKLYGSDDRLHACITEIGIPLSRESGFHQWDIRGSAHGILSSHPVAPFLSIHHVGVVDPFYPGLSSLESLQLFMKAMRVEPTGFLQRSICYDREHRLTFLVSLGYVVQVFPNIVLPRELERSEQTFSAWNGISQRNEFDFDIRDPYKSICKKPILFFLNTIGRVGNATLGSYARARRKDDLKRKVLCFPRLPPLNNVQKILVLSYPLSKKWHLAPRRLCCKLNQTSEEIPTLLVGQC